MTPIVPPPAGNALVPVDHGRRTMVLVSTGRPLSLPAVDDSSPPPLSLAQRGALAPLALPGQAIDPVIVPAIVPAGDLDAYRRAGLLGGAASGTGRLVDLLV